MTFRVGQKVVCVKRGRWIGGYRNEIDPVYGVVYTIREIETDSPHGTMLRFAEIVNRKRRYSEGVSEARYWAIHFRPVVDISDLESIVTDVFKQNFRQISDRNPLDHRAPKKIHSSAAPPAGRAASSSDAGGSAALGTRCPAEGRILSDIREQTHSPFAQQT